MPLTIVMYHYVRDLARTRYPGIKGRDLASFRRQLDHIGRHYTVVTAEQVIAVIQGGEALPDNAAWLTFDDGYSDHYSIVFPLLHERSWQGSFFPPARVIQNGELLDVNRIHFILASCPDYSRLIDAVHRFIDKHQGCEGVRTFAQYWDELAQPSRYDPAEIIFLKRIMQFALPEPLRQKLACSLFDKFVSVAPSTFAAELYMSEDQLRMMIRCGMYVGSHGAGHSWLDRFDPARQAEEIDASVSFLRGLGVPAGSWVMCYPYGVYNDTLLSLLKDRGCAVGLTTRVAVAQPGIDNPLALPRLDTNDLPA